MVRRRGTPDCFSTFKLSFRVVQPPMLPCNDQYKLLINSYLLSDLPVPPPLERLPPFATGSRLIERPASPSTKSRQDGTTMARHPTGCSPPSRTVALHFGRKKICRARPTTRMKKPVGALRLAILGGCWKRGVPALRGADVARAAGCAFGGGVRGARNQQRKTFTIIREPMRCRTGRGQAAALYYQEGER